MEALVMKRNNRGFSMVELIIVIAIMAILAAALAPTLIKYVKKARRARDVDTAREISAAYTRGVIEMDQDDNASNSYGSGMVILRSDMTLHNPPQNLEDYAFAELGGIPVCATDKDYYWKIEYDPQNGKIIKISLTPSSSSSTNYEVYPNGDAFVDYQSK